MTNELRCIVMSLRSDREVVVIESDAGIIAVVEVSKSGNSRCKVKMRARADHKVYRRKIVEQEVSE